MTLSNDWCLCDTETGLLLKGYQVMDWSTSYHQRSSNIGRKVQVGYISPDPVRTKKSKLSRQPISAQHEMSDQEWNLSTSGSNNMWYVHVLSLSCTSITVPPTNNFPNIRAFSRIFANFANIRENSRKFEIFFFFFFFFFFFVLLFFFPSPFSPLIYAWSCSIHVDLF